MNLSSYIEKLQRTDFRPRIGDYFFIFRYGIRLRVYLKTISVPVLGIIFLSCLKNEYERLENITGVSVPVLGIIFYRAVPLDSFTTGT